MFDIRNYIGNKLIVLEEMPSQVTVKCPCCGGKLRIKNNVHKGYCSYMCVTNWCDKNDIRSKLGAKPSNVTTSVKYNPDIYTPINSDISYDDIAKSTRSISYKLRQSTGYDDYYKEKIIRSTYYFDQSHRLYRIDLLESGGKHPYPNYVDPFTNQWKIGVVDTFPWYNYELMNNPHLFFTVVEGEKTAHHLTEHGIIAVTPPLGFGWSPANLEGALYRYINNMKGLLLIPDNDEMGVKKMKLLAEICSKLNIPTKILTLDNHYVNKGDDFYDLIERGYDAKSLIKEYLEV